MGKLVVELYQALRKAGVDEALAVEAASAVASANGLSAVATKADLSAGLSELKAELIKRNVGAMAVLTAIFAAISRLT